ncbi:hypothetical protein AXF24_12045 [Streptococcus pneumoniae]|nr:hypothetical protein AWW74_12075 [Streptococcus pneumoniae]KXB95033.1 hypothetical protein AXF24_12045 [Streptococcus pneumoniae]
MQADDLAAKVCTEVVSGETRYEIATSTDGTSGKMMLNFTLRRQVAEIPYVVLSFSTFGNPEEMIFEKVLKAATDNTYEAELELHELSQRDALLRALSDFDAQTTLDVGVGAGATQPFQRMGNPPGCDFAEMQVRRQPRGPDTVRQVTLLAIPAQGTVFKDGQCFQRTGFARLPVLPEAGIPVQRRRQLEIIQCQAVDRVRRQCFRCGLQWRQAPMTEYIAPVRRKYLVRLARSK